MTINYSVSYTDLEGTHHVVYAGDQALEAFDKNLLPESFEVARIHTFLNKQLVYIHEKSSQDYDWEESFNGLKALEAEISDLEQTLKDKKKLLKTLNKKGTLAV